MGKKIYVPVEQKDSVIDDFAVDMPAIESGDITTAYPYRQHGGIKYFLTSDNRYISRNGDELICEWEHQPKPS